MAHSFIMWVVLPGYLATQVYFAYWLYRNFPKLVRSPYIAGTLLILLFALFPSSRSLLRVQPGAFSQWVVYLTYCWAGISIVWVPCALLGDLATLISRFFGAADRVRPRAALAVLVVTASLSSYAIWNAWRLPRIVEVEIPLAHLPERLDGLKIVQLSDLHLGLTVPVGKFEAIARQVGGLSPDLIVLTGDFVDQGIREPERAEQVCTALRAKYGKVAVLGNHDRRHGPEAPADFIKDCGFRVLEGEVFEPVPGLQVAGVTDVHSDALTLGAAAVVLAKLDPKKASVFLSHHPRVFDLAKKQGVGLTLSGHTHAGQIFPFSLLVRLEHRYFYGLYREGDSILYVTSGAGSWGPPMRLFTRTEIVRVTLKSA